MHPSLDPTDEVFSLRGAPAHRLRPLAAIAAARQGGVPEARIRRVLIDLAGPLTALHRKGRSHGDISHDSIGLDHSGRADLIVLPRADPRGAHEAALRAGGASGFNALEQYTNDSEWEIGPWTDVYALCAAASRLVTGAAPPSAIDRCMNDRYVPLSDRVLSGYSASFLCALDAGLALRPRGRPQDVAQLLVHLGMAENEALRICSDGVLRG